MTNQAQTVMPHLDKQKGGTPPAFWWKLWLYTNYDCNLHCAYCSAKSTPTAPRRVLRLANICRLAADLNRLPADIAPFTRRCLQKIKKLNIM